MNKDVYESPLNSRYASKEMKYIFSPDKKFKTWRKLWVALAESEMELGLNVTKEQVEELRANVDNINYDVAEAREKRYVTTLCLMYTHMGSNVRMLKELFISAPLHVMLAITLT